MKYIELTKLLWLEKEIQVLTSPDSYLHKEKWQLGKKKEKHALSDKLVEFSQQYGISRDEETKKKIEEIIQQLKATIQ